MCGPGPVAEQSEAERRGCSCCCCCCRRVGRSVTGYRTVSSRKLQSAAWRTKCSMRTSARDGPAGALSRRTRSRRRGADSTSGTRRPIPIASVRQRRRIAALRARARSLRAVCGLAGATSTWPRTASVDWVSVFACCRHSALRYTSISLRYNRCRSLISTTHDGRTVTCGPIYRPRSCSEDSPVSSADNRRSAARPRRLVRLCRDGGWRRDSTERGWLTASKRPNLCRLEA